MTPTEFAKLLDRIDACPPAVTWARGKDLAETWRTCHRGDWMLWLVGRMAGEPQWPTRQQVVLAACACAETALYVVPAGEDRPRVAIETARAWARGEADIEDVRRAADAADAAAAAYAADAVSCAAAADIAAIAASAAIAAAASAYAADAADAAADAAASAAASAAADRHAARSTTLARCADIVRAQIPSLAAAEGKYPNG